MASAKAMQKVRETERKYDAPDEVQLLDPGALLGLDTGDGAADQQLDAVYFDTPDLRLARAGITLRRREGGSDAGWHLKLPAGPDSRDELRLPLGRAKRKPPAALLGLTRVYTRGAPVGPVATLSTTRRRWLLSDADGNPLAELVEDQVRGQTMGESTAAVSWREIEVELAEHGTTSLLDRIEQRLGGIGAHRSASGSKLRRLLGDRLPAPAAPRTAADSSAGDVVMAYLQEQVASLRAHDPLVRQDTPDSVHKMRVASRRMRSALQAYRRVLDQDATRELTDELKWLGGELAPARDTEVLAARLADLVAGLPGSLVLGPVSAGLDRVFARRQADARERVLAALDSDRYLALQDRLDALLAQPPLTRRAARPARRELPRGVAKAYRRTAKRMDAIDRQPPGPVRDGALHEARKATKRLRYAAEAAEPGLGKPAKRLRKQLKPVQKLLGDHQDTVVARPELRELAAQAHLDGGNGFTFGLMHGTEAERAARAEQRLPERWARLHRGKVIGWLGVGGSEARGGGG